MKNTNTAEFKNIVWRYIADCVIDCEAENMTQSEKFAYLRERFKKEFNYSANVVRYPNLQKRVAEWLAGLAIGIEFYNFDIIARAEKWHECKLTDAQSDRIVENWFDFIAFKLIQRWNLPQ